MGFGILFIGYFLLLNIAYYFYTDAIAAIITLLALHKLSGINRPFKQAMWVALGFSVFACAEFAIEMLCAYSFVPNEAQIHSAVAVLRYGILLALNVLMLGGMREVSSEVGLAKISDKCRRLIYTSAFIYTLDIILEVSSLTSFIDVRILVTLSVAALLTTLVVTAMVLFEIYHCYMRICMPGQDAHESKSRFEFVNKFRAHEEARAKEYADYKREKHRQKDNRGTRK